VGTSVSDVGSLALVFFLLVFSLFSIFGRLGNLLSSLFGSLSSFDLGGLLLSDFFTLVLAFKLGGLLSSMLSLHFSGSSSSGLLVSVHLLLSFLDLNRLFFLLVLFSQVKVFFESLVQLLSGSSFVSEEVGLSAEEAEEVVEKVLDSLTLLDSVHEHAV